MSPKARGISDATLDELRSDRAIIMASIMSGACQCPDEQHQNLLHSYVELSDVLFDKINRLAADLAKSQAFTERLQNPGPMHIDGTWLVEDVGHHTCGTGPGGHFGAHERGCGTEPVLDLSRVEGFAALRAALAGENDGLVEGYDAGEGA